MKKLGLLKIKLQIYINSFYFIKQIFYLDLTNHFKKKITFINFYKK
jgi:hypothetical protein